MLRRPSCVNAMGPSSGSGGADANRSPRCGNAARTRAGSGGRGRRLQPPRVLEDCAVAVEQHDADKVTIAVGLDDQAVAIHILFNDSERGCTPQKAERLDLDVVLI